MLLGAKTAIPTHPPCCLPTFESQSHHPEQSLSLLHEAGALSQNLQHNSKPGEKEIRRKKTVESSQHYQSVPSVQEGCISNLGNFLLTLKIYLSSGIGQKENADLLKVLSGRGKIFSQWLVSTLLLRPFACHHCFLHDLADLSTLHWFYLKIWGRCCTESQRFWKRQLKRETEKKKKYMATLERDVNQKVLWTSWLIILGAKKWLEMSLQQR